MKNLPLILLFLLLNFSALWIGQLFTGPAVASDWYQNMNKAPWTPPGWVFGFAWTFIMITYAVWMGTGWKRVENAQSFALLYAAQWILNVGWNPLFFYLWETEWALLVIILLTGVVLYSLLHYRRPMAYSSLWLLPYALWLCIATSLNAYIVWYN